MPEMPSSSPLVVCVMLVNGREAMVRRAIASFRAQAYERKRLYVYDSGSVSDIAALPDRYPECGITYHSAQGARGQSPRTIGDLRNHANSWCAKDGAEIIAHWDSDDWSHPNRLAEQVALLRTSGADAVGYRDMLFWRNPPPPGEAWLYGNPLSFGYALGASLMYWRRTWERHPFDDINKGEDDRFCLKLGQRLITTSSLRDEPRMIAAIHGGNTCARIQPHAQQFRRAPEWDGYCSVQMRLEVAE